MKSDLDQLMAARQLDAILIAGGEGYSTVRDYMSNGAHISAGYIVKVRGAEPMLVVSGMELEEARKSGLAVHTMADLGYMDIQKDVSNPDHVAVLFWGKCLQAAGLESGTVGLYGRGDINLYIELSKLSTELLPAYQIVGEGGQKLSLFDEAFITKDAQELERMQRIADKTSAVMQATWDFIGGHRAEGQIVVKEDGSPLTIGEVKLFVLRSLMDEGLEDTGMIFAQGRDAGFPHSRGEADMPLALGQSIVFDLFPREMGGGYHHDMTRTWSIGYAPEPLQKLYDTVMTAFDMAVEAYGLGRATAQMAEAVLDHFEAEGHPTPRSAPGTMKGYVHSLGHGVGLNIHERPSLTHLRREDVFRAGNVITIEPGLYYPDDGLGVRVEDTFVVTADGVLKSITTFHKELVLPLRT